MTRQGDLSGRLLLNLDKFKRILRVCDDRLRCPGVVSHATDVNSGQSLIEGNDRSTAVDGLYRE